MKKEILALVVMAAGIAASATVQSYSPPLGGLMIAIPSGQSRSISIPLIHSSIGVGNMMGTLTGVGSNYLEDLSANWSVGEFNVASNPYYLRIKSGAAVGRIFMLGATSNTASRVYVTTDGVDPALSGVATGDAYELVLADTLGSLFGSTTLQGGTSATTADEVQVWGGASWLNFYYDTTNGQWQYTGDASPTNRNNYVLRPDRGIIVARRSASALSMYVTGRIPTVAPRHYHATPGITFLSDGLPVGTTLEGLGLQNLTNWQPGTSASTAATSADYVQIWGGASWLVFYYDSGAGHWQYTGDASPTNRNSYVIPAGRPIMVRRLNSVASTASKLVNISLPYTISY